MAKTYQEVYDLSQQITKDVAQSPQSWMLCVSIHHKSKSGLRGANSHFVSRDQQIWIEHAHEPLVSQETFDKVQIMNRKVSEKYKYVNKSTPESGAIPQML